MSAGDTGPMAMMQTMLNKTLFVVLRRPANLARAADLLEAHLNWAVAMEKRGSLFASGPFAVEQGARPGSQGGLSILRAASEDEVRQLLASDPFISEGAYSADIKRWVLMEGSLTTTVRFSDQSSRIH